MRIVEKLAETAPEKLCFYLSKADTVPDESDRQKVLIQIAQNLTVRLKNLQFDIPPIYIPGVDVKVRNHIGALCQTMEKSINDYVQKSLNLLENDVHRVVAMIDKVLKENSDSTRLNRYVYCRGYLFAFCLFLVPVLIFVRLGQNQMQVCNVIISSYFTLYLDSLEMKY